ncbi:ATP-binding cassette subfamily B protein [Arthrobacter bambusae]|uniref:ATP-binding cassette subfamily B protein n=1 Tax=Arthrobacter bambusae TaxID=1338426 RepID=A0AAW8DBZ8_9MICC|nr:ABC transporter ATP-binding protein [Arthrobacter bambusae]MDP9904018.1 ATP-binding cassette subfamily B protein [Arthrobacter bambusae]MDQ0127986.1 ATP-binding cassette subfamily B protein [Arthrobacter bambusae]
MATRSRGGIVWNPLLRRPTIGGSVLASLLLQRLAPYKPHVLAIVLLQLVQTGATLLLPTFNAKIVDDGLVAGNSEVILRLGTWMLVLTVIQVLAAVLAGYLGAIVAMKVGRGLRQELFDKIHSLPDQDVAAFGPASLVVRTTNDVLQLQNITVLVFGMLVAAPVMGIGGVILAVEQDVALSWIVFAIVPVLLAIMLLIVRKLVPLYREGQGLVDRINSVLREQILGTAVIRAFVRQPFEMKRFEAANDALTRNNLRSARIVAAMLPLVMTVVNLSSAGVVWLGGHRIIAGDMELGALTAFIAYIMQILLAIMMAMYVLSTAPRAAVSAERVTEVLNTESEITQPGNTAGGMVARPSRAEGLRFDNVVFAYPGAETPVVESITFHAAPGSTTAVIGSTGSGKSTIVSLVPRLLEVSSGSISLDGRDIAAVPLNALRNQLGVVPQESWLFRGTIAENLRISLPSATDSQLWHALETAQAADFVNELPQGLETMLSQGGAGLSGGQRQRLCIARAILRPASVYLFDDSFSALDTVTEAKLRAALEPELRGATVIIVAQRINTVVSADQILLIDEGRLVAEGTHAELLESSETYREIVASQLETDDAA